MEDVLIYNMKYHTPSQKKLRVIYNNFFKKIKKDKKAHVATWQ